MHVAVTLESAELLRNFVIYEPCTLGKTATISIWQLVRSSAVERTTYVVYPDEGGYSFDLPRVSPEWV